MKSHNAKLGNVVSLSYTYNVNVNVKWF